ncbi:MAG: fibronectin type III domain-containing protein [Bacteroidetes bacterium]|nr:fibronectin type III domain-containing protein [Bacteroidota bacterium]
MKVRNFLLSGLVVAAMGLVAVGCNENPTDNPSTGNSPLAPTSLMASSTGPDAVALKWTPATDTGTITFKVAWKSADGTDSGSVSGLTSSTQTVTGLKVGKQYTFSVTAVRGTLSSTAATVDAAGATRYGSTTSLKLYESVSSLPSGLVVDPALGGPAVVSVSSSNPNLSNVQLAIYVDTQDPLHFEIGPAYAYDTTIYRNANLFDHNTYISDSTFPAANLDSWYGTGSIAGRFLTTGNVSTFVLPDLQSTLGQGLYVRTGTPGNYHYARLFIKNNGGKLLQGSAPDRYIEVEISYQTGANLPFAKGSVAATPANGASHVFKKHGN